MNETEVYNYAQCFESTSGTPGKKLVEYTIQMMEDERKYRICENCEYYNSQDDCPLYSMYSGHDQFVGLGVSCATFKKEGN
jgi:hypothetical protein